MPTIKRDKNQKIMSDKGAKRSRKNSAQVSPGKFSFGQWLYRPPVLLAMATLCSSPIIFGYLARHLPAAGLFPNYKVEASQVFLIPEPDPKHVPVDIKQALLRDAGITLPVSVWDKKLAEKLYVACKAYPWIENVEQVEIVPDSGINIKVTYRQAIAFVNTSSGYYPIDRHGVLLPPRDFTRQDVQNYPVIVNVQSIPQGPEGTHWGDASLVGAANLIAVLCPEGNLDLYWNRFKIKAIKIPRLESAEIDLEKMDYRIVTLSGSEIIWGIAPGVETTRQPPADQKLRMIEKYHRDFGSFIAPRGPYEIDFRDWTKTYRRQLTP